MSRPLITLSDLKNTAAGKRHDNSHLWSDKPVKKGGKESKYRNNKVEYDGKTFDSKGECGRYMELVMLEKIGEISDLQYHVTFVLSSCKYEADFVYMRDGKQVVEDFKRFKTRMYRLKKKMMLNELGITILET